ncbi:MAG: hypothetical protein QW035_00350 [Candidatus Anstonellales archaeon]
MPKAPEIIALAFALAAVVAPYLTPNFFAPVLVILGTLSGTPLNLIFAPVEITVIVASVLLINEVARDGGMNRLEGLQLMLPYLVVAIVLFLS